MEKETKAFDTGNKRVENESAQKVGEDPALRNRAV